MQNTTHSAQPSQGRSYAHCRTREPLGFQAAFPQPPSSKAEWLRYYHATRVISVNFTRSELFLLLLSIQFHRPLTSYFPVFSSEDCLGASRSGQPRLSVGGKDAQTGRTMHRNRSSAD